MRAQLVPFIFLLAATTLPAALALYVYRRGGGRGVLLLVVLLLAMSEWALAYALELVVTTPAAKIFWARAKLAGAVSLAPLWLGLTLYSTGRMGRLERRTLAALGILPVLMLVLLWTGPSNGATWRPVGPDALVTLGCSYGLLLTGAAVLISSLFAAQTLYRRQSALLLLAALAPWSANVLSLVQLAPVVRLDLTPFFFPLTAGALAWAIVRYRLLDIVPVDRGYVVQGMEEGVIVLDPQNRVVDLNPTAERVLGKASSEAIGSKISRLVSSRTGWLIDGYSEAAMMGRYLREDRAYVQVSTGEGRGSATTAWSRPVHRRLDLVNIEGRRTAPLTPDAPRRGSKYASHSPNVYASPPAYSRENLTERLHVADSGPNGSRDYRQISEGEDRMSAWTQRYSTFCVLRHMLRAVGVAWYKSEVRDKG